MIRILQTVIETSVFFLMNSHIFIYSCSLSQLNIRWSTLYISKLHPYIVLICIILMWSFQVCLSAIALYLLVIFYNSGAFFCFKTIGRNYNWFHWATSKYYFETYSGLWAVYVVGDIKAWCYFSHENVCHLNVYLIDKPWLLSDQRQWDNELLGKAVNDWRVIVKRRGTFLIDQQSPV